MIRERRVLALLAYVSFFDWIFATGKCLRKVSFLCATFFSNQTTTNWFNESIGLKINNKFKSSKVKSFVYTFSCSQLEKVDQ